MESSFYAFLSMFAFFFSPRHNAEIAFLRLQLEIQRNILAKHDIFRTFAEPEDKIRLLALGEDLGHDVKDILVFVTYPTYRRWLRKMKNGECLKKPGRPKIVCPEICLTIIRMAKDNLSWGLARIYGELKKINIAVSPNTIKRILRENNLPSPTSGHGKSTNGNWGKFISANFHSLVACDFFVKKIHTVRGVLLAHCLVFIHLGSRRVFCSPVTLNPNERWMKQQARNVAMWMENEEIEFKHLIRDNDGKFPASFDQFFKEITGKQNAVVPTSIGAPNMNAYCESFIGHIKAECLNHIFCISRDQLNYVIKQYQDYHNYLRPHQGKDIGNRVLDPNSTISESSGKIKRQKILGGLLNHYYREAA